MKRYTTPDEKFGKLHVKEAQWVSTYSNKYIWWICECGKEILKKINCVLKNHTKSCGKCSLITAEEMKTWKRFKLRMKDPKDIKPGSEKEADWLCDCGGEITTKICFVLSGTTTCCGKCNEVSAEKMKKKRGKLRMKYRKSILPGSVKKEWWLCDCGREVFVSIHDVMSGHTTSCGKCNLILAKNIYGKWIGDLTLVISQDLMPGSAKKVDWLCKCGKIKSLSIVSVIAGHTTSCGKCKLIRASESMKLRSGKLRLKEAQDMLPGSCKKVLCLCDCGNEKLISISNFVRGHTKSCGMCNTNIKFWYMNNKSIIKSMKCPILKDDIYVKHFALEDIKSTNQPFKAKCSICNKDYYPRWSDIRLGRSLTCGCFTHRISFPHTEIAEFIKNNEFEVELEYRLGKFTYDIFVPKRKLLLEFNGLRWHSYDIAKSRDMIKYKEGIKLGYSYLSIFEDEWKYNRAKVETLIKNKLKIIKSQSIRPSKCEIKIITSQEANLFYEQFHYIGKCHPKLSYGVFHDSQLIACISFSRPTRQSKYQWELVRMASNPFYKIHGIWSKLLKKFIQEQSPISIVSFSDNRLFSGAVYEKMGFKFNDEIPSDYYWAKKHKRFHKSALRKTNEEKLTGLTEIKLREAQGYKKIWDIGKKRWVLNVIF